MADFPHVAGTRLTPNEINRDDPMFAIQQSTQSVTSNATTSVPVIDLWALLDGNSIYQVWAVVSASQSIDAATTIDVNTNWSFPLSSTSFGIGGFGPGGSGTNMTSTVSTFMAALSSASTSIRFGADDTPNAFLQSGTVYTGPPGVIRFQFRQFTANANAASILFDSFLVVQKVG